MFWRESVGPVYPNTSPLSQCYRNIVLRKSPRRRILGLSEDWLVYRFSLTAELFLLRTVQTLCSFERLWRCNVRSSWVVRVSNFRYHRLFAIIRRVTGKEWSSVVENNRCTVHLLRGLHFSAHNDLVLVILIHLCRRHLMMKNQFGL